MKQFAYVYCLHLLLGAMLLISEFYLVERKEWMLGIWFRLGAKG